MLDFATIVTESPDGTRSTRFRGWYDWGVEADHMLRTALRKQPGREGDEGPSQ